VKSLAFEASERGVSARQLKRVAFVSASITYAPDEAPERAMAWTRVRLRADCGLAAPAAPGMSRAAARHRSREIRPIGEYEQRRRPRVSASASGL
jgi:hypothetical protein